MQSKYCLPIIKESFEEVLKTIRTNSSKYDAFEIWLDYIENFGAGFDSFYSEICNISDKKFIFLFRRNNLDPIKLSISIRAEIISKILSSNIWLDLDISQHEEIVLSEKAGLKRLIISYHDYQNTADDFYLDKIVEKMIEHKPQIIKITTYCNSENDAYRLLKLKQKFMQQNIKHIVLGMGENGKITRVFGAMWDNELTFIPEDSASASAPGQLMYDEFERIKSKINARQ